MNDAGVSRNERGPALRTKGFPPRHDWPCHPTRLEHKIKCEISVTHHFDKVLNVPGLIHRIDGRQIELAMPIAAMGELASIQMGSNLLLYLDEKMSATQGEMAAAAHNCGGRMHLTDLILIEGAWLSGFRHAHLNANVVDRRV